MTDLFKHLKTNNKGIKPLYKCSKNWKTTFLKAIVLLYVKAKVLNTIIKITLCAFQEPTNLKEFGLCLTVLCLGVKT